MNSTSPRRDTSEPAEAPTRPPSDAEREQTVIPVLQEELEVGTRRVETGAGIRVEKTVEEREERVDEPLTKEEVEVERIPVNRAVEGPVAVRYEGDTMIVPVLEEVLVLEKRLVLKEEIRITRRQREFHDPQRIVLRREHATVERIEDPDVPRYAAGGRHAGPGGRLEQSRCWTKSAGKTRRFCGNCAEGRSACTRRNRRTGVSNL